MTAYSFHLGINRIRLEFKVDTGRAVKLPELGINRIRLEFKANYARLFEVSKDSINRIRLEFKVVKVDAYIQLNCVLIESDWNLKWKLMANRIWQGRSINRIRLEFKVPKASTYSETTGVLIESDWNLKLKVQKIQQIAPLVLIESDWNLKGIEEAVVEQGLAY